MMNSRDYPLRPARNHPERDRRSLAARTRTAGSRESGRGEGTSQGLPGAEGGQDNGHGGDSAANGPQVPPDNSHRGIPPPGPLPPRASANRRRWT